MITTPAGIVRVPDTPPTLVPSPPMSTPTSTLFNMCMKIDQALARARPVRRPAVPDDGAPPQRCPCCPCRGAEMVSLGAIRPGSSVARPRNRRSIVGMGLKGGLVGCAHELRRRHRRLGGRAWAARRAVCGRFPTAVLPTLGFLSHCKVRPATSTQVLPVERW